MNKSFVAILESLVVSGCQQWLRVKEWKISTKDSLEMSKLCSLFVILVFVLFWKSGLGCRCDARLGFGNICGHRLALSPSDGCKRNSLYFCDKNIPNGLAQEVKNCVLTDQFCVYGWTSPQENQSDVCVDYYFTNFHNLTSIDFKSSLMTTRA